MQKRKKWTEEEDNWLKINYPLYGKHYCSEYLNSTTNSVAGRVVRLSLSYTGILPKDPANAICGQCLIEKPRSEFHPAKDRKTGHRNECKECASINNKNARNANPEEFKRRKKEYYDKNREQNIKREYQKKKKRYHSDPTFKMMCLIRNRFKNVFQKSRFSKEREKIVGCNPQFLLKHMEAQFSDGMSWISYSEKQWQIDHILPVSLLEKYPDKVYLIFNYRNHQPLLRRENTLKHNRLDIAKQHLLAKIEKFGMDEVYQEMLNLLEEAIKNSN